MKPIAIAEATKDVVIETLDCFKKASTEVQPLLIISYEKFRQYSDILQAIPCGLIICDEVSFVTGYLLCTHNNINNHKLQGHRLKNANIKTSQAIMGLPTRRRVILSGTPIQNDLDGNSQHNDLNELFVAHLIHFISEFFTMCDFCNPGILDTYKSFKNHFANPILISREETATPIQKREGTERAKHVRRTQIIIRRSDRTLVCHYTSYLI